MENCTFKEFYDEENRLVKQTRINFGQCDRNQKMHLSELLLFTSDAAVEDCDLRGLTWTFLKEHNTAILASRASFHINKMPVRNQYVTIKTWEEKPSGLQLTRRYEIFDTETGENLVSGSSLWIVVDLTNRKIVPAKLFKLRPEPEFTTEFNGIAPGKIKMGENARLMEKRKIRFSDIDSNGHVNNSKYGNYAADVLSDYILQKDIKDFRINWSKEAVEGEEIELWVEAKENGSIVVTGKGSTENCFEAEMYFK